MNTARIPPTRVTFPAGEVIGRGRVVAVLPLAGDRTGVITDVTPFHPLDHTWPDQPADRGMCAGAPVLDCLTGAVGPDGVLAVGAEVPVRRGDPEWVWVVVHVLDAGVRIAVGDEVDLEVDAEYRRSLSLGHTACHLAALALNAQVAPRWTKPVDRLDDLGNPDFDSLAITASEIVPLGAIDEYRLGRSVRRKGLPTAALTEDLPAVQQSVNDLLSEWAGTGGSVTVETGGDPLLTARRLWVAELPVGRATIPCGGTHVHDLAELGSASVAYEATEEGFRVVTSVSAR